jgi:hypothetical protein
MKERGRERKLLKDIYRTIENRNEDLIADGINNI